MADKRSQEVCETSASTPPTFPGSVTNAKVKWIKITDEYAHAGLRACYFYTAAEDYPGYFLLDSDTHRNWATSLVDKLYYNKTPNDTGSISYTYKANYIEYEWDESFKKGFLYDARYSPATPPKHYEVDAITF